MIVQIPRDISMDMDYHDYQRVFVAMTLDYASVNDKYFCLSLASILCVNMILICYGNNVHHRHHCDRAIYRDYDYVHLCIWHCDKFYVHVTLNDFAILSILLWVCVHPCALVIVMAIENHVYHCQLHGISSDLRSDCHCAV